MLSAVFGLRCYVLGALVCGWRSRLWELAINQICRGIRQLFGWLSYITLYYLQVFLHDLDGGNLEFLNFFLELHNPNFVFFYFLQGIFGPGRLAICLPVGYFAVRRCYLGSRFLDWDVLPMRFSYYYCHLHECRALFWVCVVVVIAVVDTFDSALLVVGDSYCISYIGLVPHIYSKYGLIFSIFALTGARYECTEKLIAPRNTLLGIRVLKNSATDSVGILISFSVL